MYTFLDCQKMKYFICTLIAFILFTLVQLRIRKRSELKNYSQTSTFFLRNVFLDFPRSTKKQSGFKKCPHEVNEVHK